MKEDRTEAVVRYIEERYGVQPEHPWYSYPDYMTFKDKIADKWFAIIMNVERKKLGLPGSGEVPVVNVKADPEFIGFIAGNKGYLSAYHMNKKHWLSVLLDGSLSEKEIFARIDESFALITDNPTRRIYEAVKRIPAGHVATYGKVAEMAGNPKMSRAVGNALHKNPDPENIPCFRVVNSKGELAGGFAFGGEEVQAKLLIEDGVEVVNGKVDLSRYGI